MTIALSIRVSGPIKYPVQQEIYTYSGELIDLWSHPDAKHIPNSETISHPTYGGMMVYDTPSGKKEGTGNQRVYPIEPEIKNTYRYTVLVDGKDFWCKEVEKTESWSVEQTSRELLMYIYKLLEPQKLI